MSVITMNQVRKGGIPLPGRSDSPSNKRPNQQNPEKVIKQVDLEEIIYLRRLMEEAHERWVSKREEICAALEAGAKTEFGVHTVMILTDDRYRRLVVR